MGVPGLFTYINNDENNFESFQLHNTCVVFDANNVLHFIHDSCSSLTIPFNGEYLAFDAAVEELIETFKKCQIKPIFVFDGVHEVSENCG